MVDVQTEILINRPKYVVSEYAANPDSAPEWYDNIKSVQWETPKPLSLGSKIKFQAQFLRRQLVYTYEMIELNPGDKLTMSTSEGPFPMETTYTWETVGNGNTRMKLRNRGNPAGFSKLFSPFMEFAIRRANRKDLLRLKYILEK
jgi:hypothetical protein